MTLTLTMQHIVIHANMHDTIHEFLAALTYVQLSSVPVTPDFNAFSPPPKVLSSAAKPSKDFTNIDAADEPEAHSSCGFSSGFSFSFSGSSSFSFLSGSSGVPGFCSRHDHMHKPLKCSFAQKIWEK